MQVEPIEAPTAHDIHEAIARLESELARLSKVVVAFSGGADSALLAHVATTALGRDNVLCATANSASLAPEELADVRALAAQWQLRHVALDTSELDNPAYVENDLDRCYHCKAELLDVLGPLAERERATVVLGVNLDDLGEHRPGQAAALERGAAFPLVEAGFSKALVRAASRQLGLRTWDKPAAACLASRVPYGTPVTIGTLARVQRAESALREMGFRQLRVRHHGETARIEIDLAEMHELLLRREDVVAACQHAGYRTVSLDLEGFRSGSLTRAALNDEGKRPT